VKRKWRGCGTLDVDKACDEWLRRFDASGVIAERMVNDVVEVN